MQPIIPSEDLRREIWAKGKPVHGEDPAVLREDERGFWMIFDEFRTDHMHAWDIVERTKTGPRDGDPQRELIPIATLPYKNPIDPKKIALAAFDALTSLDRGF